jgi:hypothetical protein
VNRAHPEQHQYCGNVPYHFLPLFFGLAPIRLRRIGIGSKSWPDSARPFARGKAGMSPERPAKRPNAELAA